jgi:Na+-driven multidrug efflux pump
MFGSTAVAAFTAAWRIQNILTQEMVAMGQTMAAFCGQNFGKKDFARIREGVRTAVRIETIYSVAAGIASVAFLPLFLRLFFSAGADLGALMPWAMTYTVECAIFFVPLSYIFLFRNAMQGCSSSFLPLMGGVVEMAARVLSALAGMRLHSYLLSAGCDGAAWLTAGIFLVLAYLHVMRRLETGQQPDPTGLA